MFNRRTVIVGATAAGLAPAAALAANPAYWPTASAWETIDPKSAGFDPAKLQSVVGAVLADGSLSVMVLRGGRIVAETYSSAGGVDKPREIASAGKSMVSVLTGMAIDDGKIKSVDQSASAFIPAWKGGPREAITIRHLISMTSGLDDTGLALRRVTGDQFALNSGAPLANPPGSHWAYNTAVYHLMFHIVERAVGEPFEAYAKRKLLGPLGMSGTTWLTNKGKDAAGHEVTNYYTALCTARDLARFGLFARNGGQWNGKVQVKADYFKSSTSPSQDINPAYGWLWWENAQQGVAAGGRGAPAYLMGAAPRDAFAALGAAGQMVIVVPSLDLVVIRQGTAPAGAAQTSPLINAVIGAVS